VIHQVFQYVQISAPIVRIGQHQDGKHGHVELFVDAHAVAFYVLIIQFARLVVPPIFFAADGFYVQM
jgi:hypothetical protein